MAYRLFSSRLPQRVSTYFIGSATAGETHLREHANLRWLSTGTGSGLVIATSVLRGAGTVLATRGVLQYCMYYKTTNNYCTPVQVLYCIVATRVLE
jgi:hypothetical protein